MKTICLKFTDKATAHSLLYSADGEPLYPDIADRSRAGLPVEYFVTEEGEGLRWPEDGSYCADVRDSRYADSVPEALQPYAITPQEQYRKHKFSGE